MSRIVVDCSAALCWCFADEATPAAQRLFDRVERSGGVVPMLWRLEIANVLLLAERRKRLEAGGARKWVTMLRRLPIDTDMASVNDPDLRVFDFAAEDGLTTYDAAYLDLAIRTGLPLASKDKDLVKAARRHGVDLFPLLDT